jgi:thiamine-monophosphate kinase
MTGAVSLGSGPEFDAIRQMTARWGRRAHGIGDDAAIVRLPRGDSLVASVDTATEGVHFRAGWLTPREISYRAVVAALSDLAAMAAQPTGVLVAMTIPQRWRSALMDLADGIADAVDVVGTVIRGGNLSDGRDLSITTTVFGASFAPLRRSGAKVGDSLFVTGHLGAPAMALGLFEAGNAPGAFRDRFAHPVPRVAEARWLANHGATAAIDISDGLVADAEHLATASDIRLEVAATQIPLFPGADIDVAIASGEEYELLITGPADLDAAQFTRRFGIPLTRIGVANPSTNDARVVVHGTAATAHGHDHFSA